MRTTAKIALVVALLIAPSVRTYHPALAFPTPNARLRLETSQGWVIHLQVPEPYIRVIEKHVDAMYARRYFDDLVSNDLWHGHLMMRPGAADEYGSVSAYLQDVALIVYHTAEFAERWAHEAPKPLDQRRPRSVAGFTDGSIITAISLVKPEYVDVFYASNGTVFDDNIRDSHPDWFEPSLKSKTLRIGPHAKCAVGPQFVIVQDPEGRLMLKGRRYDAFIICTPDPRELGLDGYDTRLQNFVQVGGDHE